MDQFESDPVPLEGLHPHDEEESGEDTSWDQVEDYEERARHGSEGENALSEVRDTLLDNMVDHSCGVTFCVARLGFIGDLAGDAKGVGVEGRLRDETVRKGYTEEA